MSDAKLMMPLFCNGMFNCGGRRIRAVHLYDVSDGEHRYRLWTKAGTPDIDYFLMFPASCAASFYCAYCYENTLVWSWYAVYGTCSDVL